MTNILKLNDYKPVNSNISRHDVETTNYVSSTSRQNSTNFDINKKITFGEGIKLFAKGIVQQAKDIVSAIIKHPLKTLAVIGGTSAALFALPLIGIPTAVGGAAMALGFAGLAAVKGLKHAVQFVKNNKDGSYDVARENLKQLGGDTLDLALSAPFVPKGMKEIKRFTKYGKLSVNKSAIKEIINKKGLNAKWNVLKDANNEASRVMNFNQATEVELAKLDGITDIEKAKIKQYIKDYNVPKDKIPEVVLDQWAKERGISTKPEWGYKSMGKHTNGSASPSECKINLNDFKDNNVPPVATNCNAERYEQIGLARKDAAGRYIVDYKDIQTGEVFSESIDAKLVESRRALLKAKKNCSPEGQRILTTTHEREHINQFAIFYKNGKKFKGLTPQAEKLYQQMAAEIKPLTAEQTNYYTHMANYRPKRRTITAYTAEPAEVQARMMESKLLGQKRFQTLDKVFKAVNEMKIAAISAKDYVLNLVRAQSAVA